jgi:hypothetical protein
MGGHGIRGLEAEVIVKILSVTYWQGVFDSWQVFEKLEMVSIYEKGTVTLHNDFNAADIGPNNISATWSSMDISATL